MTTIIIDENTKKGRLFLDLIQEMGVGEINDDMLESHDIFNNTTLKAIKDAREGKTIKCDDFDDYIKKVKHRCI